MKNIAIMLLVCLTAGAAFGADVAKKGSFTHPDTTGWETLIAPDFSNAVNSNKVWTFEDGMFTASKDEMLWTQKEYENFVVDLEFKNGPAANSGVAVYCSNPADWIPNSVEVQILDDYAKKWADAPKTWLCAGIFGHLAPSKQTVKKAGEWNHMTVRCVGPMIDVVLNGEMVTSMDMTKWTSAKTNPDGSEIPTWLSKAKSELPTKGRIGFQGKHGGAPIWFRNIKVKELK